MNNYIIILLIEILYQIAFYGINTAKSGHLAIIFKNHSAVSLSGKK